LTTKPELNNITTKKAHHQIQAAVYHIALLVLLFLSRRDCLSLLAHNIKRRGMRECILVGTWVSEHCYAAHGNVTKANGASGTTIARPQLRWHFWALGV
jgi:hypothetical protein